MLQLRHGSVFGVLHLGTSAEEGCDEEVLEAITGRLSSFEHETPPALVCHWWVSRQKDKLYSNKLSTGVASAVF